MRLKKVTTKEARALAEAGLNQPDAAQAMHALRQLLAGLRERQT